MMATTAVRRYGVAARRLVGMPYSDVMVRAILGGHKMQTRRLVDTYRVGDIAYIREAWRTCLLKPTKAQHEAGIAVVAGCQFRADMSVQAWPGRIVGEHARVAGTWAVGTRGETITRTTPSCGGLVEGTRASSWRPPRFMFRALARTVRLEIVDRRVERLQEISERDAKAEGSWTRPDFKDTGPDSYRYAFHQAWDEINGDGAWTKNPTVYAYTFRIRYAAPDGCPDCETCAGAGTARDGRFHHAKQADAQRCRAESAPALWPDYAGAPPKEVTSPAPA